MNGAGIRTSRRRSPVPVLRNMRNVACSSLSGSFERMRRSIGDAATFGGRTELEDNEIKRTWLRPAPPEAALSGQIADVAAIRRRHLDPIVRLLERASLRSRCRRPRSGDHGAHTCVMISSAWRAPAAISPRARRSQYALDQANAQVAKPRRLFTKRDAQDPTPGRHRARWSARFDFLGLKTPRKSNFSRVARKGSGPSATALCAIYVATFASRTRDSA